MSEVNSRIMSEVLDATKNNEEWGAVGAEQAASIHIAVLAEPYLSRIFSGEKTVESRLSVNRCAPYNRVELHDIVLMKHGPLVGSFQVSWVQYHDLTRQPLRDIVDTYCDAIGANDEYWEGKQRARYATLLGIEMARRLPPLTISKHDQRGWVVLPSKTQERKDGRLSAFTLQP